MFLEWLQQRVTVEEAERAHLVVDDRLGPEPVPFGFQHEEWKQLIAQMDTGDDLWQFRSPPETWRNMCGRAGYVVIRSGQIIGSVVTLMN